LVAKSIFKFSDSQRKTLRRWVITYIGVGVKDVPWRLAHEAKAGEVTYLALGLLILLWAGEVEVDEGYTRSRHHLLELLILLLIPEVVLLLAPVLIAGVIPVIVVVLVGGVKLLPLRGVGNEVGGVTTLKAAARRPPTLLAKPVKNLKLSRQQSDLDVRDTLILLIRNYTQGKQNKLKSRWVSSVGGVSHMTTNMSTSNQSLTREGSIMIRTTFPR
jgi:hypothetical protein